MQSTLAVLLQEFPAVALLGPRQVGKTTLALTLAADRPHRYLDLESPADQARLADPETYFEEYGDLLIVLDEVHRMPALFPVLRGCIDRARRAGREGRFLLLGSASLDLLRQAGESLAGRIGYTELCPFDLRETAVGTAPELWLRGGFPSSFLAPSADISRRWRQQFIRAYLEREIPGFGVRLPAETLRRLWIMLAHSQGGLFNASELARSLGVDSKTVARYVDLLVDLFLVRRLPPFHVNVGKRLVKSPRLYVRDSGLLHALLDIRDLDALRAHPVAGGSWEGFVIENLLAAAPADTVAHFYRTTAGAEVDLLLDLPGGRRIAVEIKLSSAPTLSRGSHLGLADVGPSERFVVYNGKDSFPLGTGLVAIGLTELMAHLAAAT